MDSTRDKPRTVFQSSQKICAESIEIMIGDFVCVQSEKNEKVQVSIYSLNGVPEQGKLALEVSEKAIKFFSLFFNLPFPLTKLNFIAMKNFELEEVENFGFVVLNENQILTDLLYSNIDHYEVIVNVAYYIAHQWILFYKINELPENIVDCGLAVILANFFIKEIFPENVCSIKFLFSNSFRKINLVSYDNNMSIINIACLLNMINSLVTPDEFKNIIKLYLERKMQSESDSDAQVPDLWTILESVSEKKKVTTWIPELGFPILNATEISTSVSNKRLSLRQKICLTSKDDSNTDTMLGEIPVVIRSEENPSQKILEFVMRKQTIVVDLPETSKNIWISIYSDSYISIYEDTLMNKLIQGIEFRTLPLVDRLGLLKDMFISFQAGHKSLVEVLKLLIAFKKEDNCIVWKEILAEMNLIKSLLAHSKDTSQTFKTFVSFLLKNCMDRLGWFRKNEESDSDTLLR